MCAAASRAELPLQGWESSTATLSLPAATSAQADISLITFYTHDARLTPDRKLHVVVIKKNATDPDTRGEDRKVKLHHASKKKRSDRTETSVSKRQQEN